MTDTEINGKVKNVDMDSHKNIMFNLRLNFDEAMTGGDGDSGGPSFGGEGGDSSW